MSSRFSKSDLWNMAESFAGECTPVERHQAVTAVYSDLLHTRRHYAGLAVAGFLLLVVVLAAVLTGCSSAGEAYQASSIAFIGAVDAASELRAAGKLDESEVAAINSAVAEGSAALHTWAEKVKAGQDDPGAEPVVQSAVDRIRVRLKR